MQSLPGRRYEMTLAYHGNFPRVPICSVKSNTRAFLAEPHGFRSIGALATDNQFAPTRLATQFDVVIYFDHTTASLRLPAGPMP